MKYHTPNLPAAVDHKAIMAFIEAIGLPEDIKALHIDRRNVTVTVNVLDEDGKVVQQQGVYKLITTDVEIPIARNEARDNEVKVAFHNAKPFDGEDVHAATKLVVRDFGV